MPDEAVFITGIAGFLGSHLAQELLDRDFHVVGIDNLLGGDPDNVPDQAELVVADCVERDEYSFHLDDVRVVYHCAAAPYEGMSAFAPYVIHHHTASATAAVLSASVAAGVERFVFCSSMARYGAQRPPFTEDMPVAPVDPYGISKYSAELLVRNVCETHGVEWAIAVPHNIIGPRQKFDDPYRNVASIMINRMLRDMQPVIYGDGSQRRCFSYVADVVPSLARMGLDPALNGEVVNLGPDEEFVSILELAELIAELMEVPLDPVFLPPRPLEVHAASCSAAKARRLLGYRTRWTLREGLSEMISWIRSVGPREFVYHLPLEIVTDRTPASWSHQLI